MTAKTAPFIPGVSIPEQLEEETDWATSSCSPWKWPL